MQWADGILPEHLYMFACIPESTAVEVNLADPSIEWNPVEDADDSIKALMRWLYDYHVLFLGDKTVCCYEQNVFFVSSACFEACPGHTWGAQLDVFDVWKQQKAVFLFCLS